MNRPTQVDVARRAGVSRATVSYVLNGVTEGRVPISDETKQRVLEAIEELGYQPDARAQALRSGSTKTIALIIPDLRNPHFCEYATGIEEAARAAGYHMLLSSTTLNDEYAVEVFKDLSRRRFDGLIIASSFILESKEAQATLDQVRRSGLPIWCSGVAAPASVNGLTFVGWQQPIGCGGCAIFPGDVVVADDDGAVVIPQAMVEFVAREGAEHELYESWVVGEVENGVKLPGLYPPNDEAKARYAEWRKSRS